MGMGSIAKLALASSSLALALGTAAPASAACTWAGGPGDYAESTKWSCNRSPGREDDIVIPGPGQFEVDFENDFLGYRTFFLHAGPSARWYGNQIRAGGTTTINGRLNVMSGARVRSGIDSGIGSAAKPVLLTGSGVLNMAGGAFLNGRFQIDPSLTVQGFGSFGLSNEQLTLINFGNITGNSSTGLSFWGYLDGNGIPSGGVGTSGRAAIYNGGQIRATGGLVTFESGLVENEGLFEATQGGTLRMNASLANLTATSGGLALRGGTYRVTGATMLLNSHLAGNITRIGGDGSAIDTFVELGRDGLLGRQTSGSPIYLAQSLNRIAATGQLTITNSGFQSTAGSLAIAGRVRLDGGTLSGFSLFLDGGTIFGRGTLVATGLNGAGQIRAEGGTLALVAGQGVNIASSTLKVAAGSLLDITAITPDSLSVRTLELENGLLALGGKSILVGTDYSNSAFLPGSNFNGRASVTGTGAINALSATQTLTGAGLDLAANTLDVGGIRLGQQKALLTITNQGTQTILRGGISDTAGEFGTAPSFVLNPNGGSLTLFATADATGSFAGDTLTIRNNFDNIADHVLTLSGAVYTPAIAGNQPASIRLNASRVGGAGASSTVTFANLAANDAFSEALISAAALDNGLFLIDGAAATTVSTAGGASQGRSLSVVTGQAGLHTGVLSIKNQSRAPLGAGLEDLDLGSQFIALTAAVYQSAIASAQPAAIQLGARRVGDAVTTAQLGVANIAPDTGGFTEALQSTAALFNAGRSGFRLNGAASAQTGLLGIGQKGAWTLSNVASGAGTYTDVVRLEHITKAMAGTRLGDALTRTDFVEVTSNIYAAAVAQLDRTSIDLGPVRRGGVATGTVRLTNAAAGALADHLVTSPGTVSPRIGVDAPDPLAQGDSGEIGVTFLGTGQAGAFEGAVSLDFLSRNPEMADLALASQSIKISGLVTETAKAELLKTGGAGLLTGADRAFTLDFGALRGDAVPAVFGLGVRNGIDAATWAEALSGSFSFTPGEGFAFSGGDLVGLGGGKTAGEYLLSFDPRGLGTGAYRTTLVFNGFSRFAGLDDLALGPITIDVLARVAAVPEPTTWAQLVAGFGLLGGFARRRAGTPRTTAAN